MQGGRVTVGFLKTLGVAPVVGRFFQDGEDAASAPRNIAVLSEGLWTRRFGRDPAIVGRTIQVDGVARTVIGIMPRGPVWLETRDLLVPMLRRTNANRGSWEYTVIGRLAPGQTFASAQSDLVRVMSNLRQYKDNDGIGVLVRGADDWIAGPELRRALWVMLGAVGLLLVIASVNVTNLLFVRASGRARERAVRTALGAGRGDLVREGLTESMLLAGLGAAAGWAIAYGMLAAFKAADPGGIPRLTSVTLDAVVFVFTIGLAALVGLATGIVPALRVPFASLVTALREGQRGTVGDRAQDRTRAIFVGLEVAISVVLLVGAALLIRSLQSVLNQDRGFATENRLTAEISIPSAYPEGRRAAMVQELLTRVGAMPEIESVAAVSGPMLVGGGTGMTFAAADAGNEGAAPWATWRLVTKDYFDAIGLRLLGGRGFADTDELGKPWRVIISQRLADKIWPGQTAVGRSATLWKGQGNLRAEVIGVVSDIREHRLDDDPTLEVYIPAYGDGMAATTLRLVMHTRVDPDAVGPALRAVVKSVDPTLPVSRVRSVESLVEQSVATRRFTMRLLAVFAAIAAVLALAGVAGVLAYSMSRRTGEMGLRLALGAQYGELLTLAVRVGLAPVVIGLAVGLGVAFWASRLMTSLLYGITASDPLTYAGVAAGLLLAALVVCYLPARRVLAIDPAIALRTD